MGLGFEKSIVRQPSLLGIIADKPHAASSKWSLFTLDQSPDEEADINETEETHGNITPNLPPQVDTSPSNHSLSIVADDAAEATISQSDSPAMRDSPPSPVTPALSFVSHGEDIMAVPTISIENSAAHQQRATEDPLLLEAPSAQKITPVRTTEQASACNLSVLPIPSCDDPASLRLPANVQEPDWMKKKRTLDYFKSSFKMGGLSSLISNWYLLEAALGFPEHVCFP